MRICEIASAEDQMALWKIISDHTWQAIDQQVADEKQQRAAAAAQRRLKPKAVGSRGSRVSVPPPPKSPSPKTPPPKSPLQPTSFTQAPADVTKPMSPTELDSLENTVGKPQLKLAADSTNVIHTQKTVPAQQPLTPQQMRLQRQKRGLQRPNSADGNGM